jgi:large subunit ribosomal protein L3
MKFTLGRKLNMTQIFDKEGAVRPATVIEVSPVVVTQVKSVDSDGYSAVQVGTGERNKSRITKAVRGHIKEAGNFSHISEFRVEDTAPFKVGDTIDSNLFKEGDTIQVSGVSKGKGFQGVVKRHGFAGGPRTHGQKHSEREPGSIGGGLRNKVPKRMRMAGRMGGDRVTVKNLEILHVDPTEKLIYISGAVPGRRGTMLEIISK